MRSIIGVCTSPPEAESFSFGCTSFDEREKRREITQCECNERNLHEVASKLRQILLGNTSITIPPAVAIFLGWKIVFLGVVSSLERTRTCWN